VNGANSLQADSTKFSYENRIMHYALPHFTHDAVNWGSKTVPGSGKASLVRNENSVEVREPGQATSPHNNTTIPHPHTARTTNPNTRT
jgi:hypothetical protein